MMSIADRYSAVGTQVTLFFNEIAHGGSLLEEMAASLGIEPRTYGLTVRRYYQLSYKATS